MQRILKFSAPFVASQRAEFPDLEFYVAFFGKSGSSKWSRGFFHFRGGYEQVMNQPIENTGEAMCFSSQTGWRPHEAAVSHMMVAAQGLQNSFYRSQTANWKQWNMYVDGLGLVRCT